MILQRIFRFSRLPFILAIFMLLTAHIVPHHHHIPGITCSVFHTHGPALHATDTPVQSPSHCPGVNCPIHTPCTPVYDISESQETLLKGHRQVKQSLLCSLATDLRLLPADGLPHHKANAIPLHTRCKDFSRLRAPPSGRSFSFRS